MIVAVGGWRGVGATTTAFAVATSWAADGDEVWMIEADPAGGVLSGRVDMGAASVGGLERVAFPTDRGLPLDEFRSVAHQMGGLRIVSAPVDPFRAFSCHQPRMPWVPSLVDLGDLVVVDVGRVRAGTPAWDVMSIADVVLVVSGSEVASAVSSAEWVHAAGRVSPADPALDDDVARLCIVESVGGVCFSKSTLVADLGSSCAGWIPWDPASVDLLHRGATTSDRRFRRTGWWPAVQRLAERLRSTDHEPTGVRA